MYAGPALPRDRYARVLRVIAASIVNKLRVDIRAVKRRQLRRQVTYVSRRYAVTVNQTRHLDASFARQVRNQAAYS